MYVNYVVIITLQGTPPAISDCYVRCYPGTVNIPGVYDRDIIFSMLAFSFGFWLMWWFTLMIYLINTGFLQCYCQIKIFNY